MTVKVDIAEGEILSETARGYEHTRTFDVTGYSGSGPQLLHAAINTAGIPVRGDPHPVIPGIRVLSREARQLARNPSEGHIARITIIYGFPDEFDDPFSQTGGGQVDFSAGLLTDRTIRDNSGTVMRVRFVQEAGKFIESIPIAEVERPFTRVSISRVESRAPTAVALEFTGTVNSSPWSGFPQNTWRCDGVRSTTVNRGTGVLVDYEFSYRRETWRFIASISEAGIIPDGVTVGNGIEGFDVYPGADFNRLGILVPS